MSKKYLVYGANGRQGGAVVQALLAQNEQVRVLSRDPARSVFRDDRRVEVMAGDLNDPSSLRRASQGVSGVYLMMPLSFDHERVRRWGRDAIDAATQSSAEMLVLNTSGLVPDEPVGLPLLDTKRELESYLRDQRIPSVTLRSTLYMGNLTAPWSAPRIVHQGVLAYPLPEALPVSWLSWEDAAAYAVAAFGRPALGAEKAVLQLGGVEALTGRELAAALSRVLRRPIDYFCLPLAELERGLNEYLGAPAGSELARYYAWLGEPRAQSPLAVDVSRARSALPVAPLTFEAWASEIPWSMLAGAPR